MDERNVKCVHKAGDIDARFVFIEVGSFLLPTSLCSLDVE